MSIKVKRVYDPPEGADGFRVLADRLWPRGLSKSEARIDLWLKDVAPSDDLRKWFGHDPVKWSEFCKRYFRELDEKHDLVRQIVEKARHGTVTLLFAAKDEIHNNAVALKDYIEKPVK